MKNNDKLDRPEFLRKVAGVPIAAAAISLIAQPAEAADNKAQFKYQNKPGPGGNKCSQCNLFRPPHACGVVTGTISPNGWCIAWVKK